MEGIVHDFFRDLPEGDFERKFVPLADDETFSAVVSGVYSIAEIHYVGTRLQQAGLSDIDPLNPSEVLTAARAVTNKICELRYHP